MEVENYVQDTRNWNSFANNGRGAYGIRQENGRITRRKVERMVRDARRYYLDGFGIDWSQYDEPSVTFYEMVTAQIEWEHKTSKQKIVLTHIFWDDKNGAILQAGTNYGDLTL